MKTEQPTEAQLKEFWEWCGCKYENYDSPAFPHMGGAWIDPNGKTIMDENGFTNLPPLDLNNIFKWAVPQFTIKFGIAKTRELLHCWVNEAYMSLPSANELRLLIWEVIKSGVKP